MHFPKPSVFFGRDIYVKKLPGVYRQKKQGKQKILENPQDAGFDFQISVLTTGRWPSPPSSPELRLPAVLQQLGTLGSPTGWRKGGMGEDNLMNKLEDSRFWNFWESSFSIWNCVKSWLQLVWVGILNTGWTGCVPLLQFYQAHWDGGMQM